MNDGHPAGSSDRPSSGTVLEALEMCAMMRCFMSSCQSNGRPIDGWGVNAPDSVWDERDERLERGGYLLVVYIERLVHGIAALALGIGRSVMKLVMAPQQMGARFVVDGPNPDGELQTLLPMPFQQIGHRHPNLLL